VAARRRWPRPRSAPGRVAGSPHARAGGRGRRAADGRSAASCPPTSGRRPGGWRAAGRAGRLRPAAATLVHGDFHPGNWRSSPGRPPAVLDFADAYLGNPVVGRAAGGRVPARGAAGGGGHGLDGGVDAHAPGSTLARAGRRRAARVLGYGVRYQEFWTYRTSERNYHAADDRSPSNPGSGGCGCAANLARTHGAPARVLTRHGRVSRDGSGVRRAAQRAARRQAVGRGAGAGQHRFHGAPTRRQKLLVAHPVAEVPERLGDGQRARRVGPGACAVHAAIQAMAAAARCPRAGTRPPAAVQHRIAGRRPRSPAPRAASGLDRQLPGGSRRAPGLPAAGRSRPAPAAARQPPGRRPLVADSWPPTAVQQRRRPRPPARACGDPQPGRGRSGGRGQRAWAATQRSTAAAMTSGRRPSSPRRAGARAGSPLAGRQHPGTNPGPAWRRR